MITLNWTTIDTFKQTPQEIISPWIMAKVDLGAATTYLMLVTKKGKWTALAGLPNCEADGLTGQSFPDDRLLMADCAVGALIGRIGGSSASLKAAAPATDSGESKPFAVGRFTIVKLPANAVGPLYLGFNILFRPIKIVEDLEVDISVSS